MRKMDILSFFTIGAVAATAVISPLADDVPVPTQEYAKPAVSFGALAAGQPAVLGDETIRDIPAESLSPTPTLTATPTPARRTKQKTVTIALLGDSMTDTLGPDAPHLRTALKKIYPATSFVIRNYGVGGTGIQYGIERITSGYTYLGKSYASLVSENPDVVVLESFGYNPFGSDESAINSHWMLLAQAVDTIRRNLPSADIVLAATIAPNATRFGDGAPGIAFSSEDKWQRVATIKKYLENAVRFGKSQKLPVADAYHASLLPDGNGNLSYINGGDHIHYSDKGRSLMASQIAKAITQNRLLE